MEYAYDLEKTLKAIPLKEISNTYEMEKLKHALRQGDRVSAVLIKNGRENQIYIEANPQFRSLNIYDRHFRKIQTTSSKNQAATFTKQSVQKGIKSKIQQRWNN